MTISEMQFECNLIAAEHGWNEPKPSVPEMIALIHSEASEALEAYRGGEPTCFVEPGNKPEGIGSEFADILIRVAHYSQLLGIDLNREVVIKMAYNRTRPFRHGGKKC